MPPQGRAEVARRRQQIESVFAQIDGVGLSAELTAHYARYLSVVVGGFVEQSTKELVTQYARKRSSPEVQRYVAAQLKRVRNVDAETLRQLLQSFDTSWWEQLYGRRPDELESLTSLVTVRNGVSHGNASSGITMGTVREYFQQVSTLLEDLSDLLDPA
ncbi:MAG TPA: HEPN domain-containing protein [Coriobacteriia bacterium]|nr:HEPN domain-containing protein [Coriobacteriia bacterium]